MDFNNGNIGYYESTTRKYISKKKIVVFYNSTRSEFPFLNTFCRSYLKGIVTMKCSFYNTNSELWRLKIII